MTTPLGATASFFDMIEPVISATLSTVAVTSRTLKIFRSAGASCAVGALIAPPVSTTASMYLSGGGEPS